MREFSLFEQKIIRKILDVFSIPGGLSVLGNVLEFELDPNLYIQLSSETECPVKIKLDYVNHLVDRYGTPALSQVVKELETKLLLTVRLIDYLESENLVILSGNLAITLLGEQEVGATYASYDLGDANLVRMVYQYSRKKLTPTQALTTLVQNNFKTDEELRLNREFQLNRNTVKWTAGSVMIAGLALVASIVIPFCQGNKVTLDDRTVHQLDSIVSQRDTIVIKNGTFTVKLDSTSIRDIGSAMQQKGTAHSSTNHITRLSAKAK